MEIVIVWLICGVFCAIVAGTKNRSALGWLALGALFGFFAVVAVLVVKSLPEENSVGTPALVMTTCPFCREVIQSGAILCKHCKSKLN